MIAPYFVPRRRVGALRPFKFSIHLRESGWQPYMVVIKSHTGELTAREKELLKQVRLFEIDTPLDRTHKSGGQLNKQRETEQKSAISEKLSRFIDRNYPIDTWLPFFFMKFREINRIYEEVRPDVIFSTGDPWSAHWLGYKFRKKHKVPWVADFRDPWTLSKVNLKERTWLSSHIDRWWEKRILRAASWLTFTSNKTKELYQAKYPEIKQKSSSIYNAFDRALIHNSDDGAATIKLEPNHLNLFFWGQFRKLSPLKPVTDVLLAFRNAYPQLADKVKVHCFGSLAEEDMQHLNALHLHQNFMVHNPVPPEDAQRVLNKADILLLSTDLARKDIIPAKLWDYLTTAVPIFSIAPNAEIKQILLETGSGLQFQPEEETDAINELLRTCVGAKVNGEGIPFQRNGHSDSIEKYDAAHTTQQLAAIFDSLVSK